MEGVRRPPYWFLILVTLTTQNSLLVSATNKLLPGMVRPVTRDCEEAWECCRFPTTSQEYNNCCLGHKCCPSCVGVSKGCCYNSLIHLWGSVVETLPEACLNLVCAATFTPIPPYLTASLVLVPWDPQLCQEKPCNVDPNQLRCVDHTGLVRNVGDVWFPDRCHRCQCVEGNRVECQEVPVRCPVRPHPSCVEVPAPCCPNWNSVVLTRTGATASCTPPGKWMSVHGTCVHRRGFKSRPSRVLQNLVLTAGRLTWRESAVLNGSVAVLTVHQISDEIVVSCRALRTPRATTAYLCTTPCPAVLPGIVDNYHCSFSPASGCYDDDGVYHELHSSWQPDPCTTILCSEAGLKTIKIPCLPPPHQNCQAQTKPGQCCPTWTCGDDCSVLCPPPPHSSCTPYKPPLACCNEWNCSGCVDAEGNLHPLYSQWQAGPCTQQVCLPDGIVNMTKECPSPPHHNCQPKPRPGDCCPEWKCGPDCIAVSCILDPPGGDCQPVHDPLSCCPTYNCSGCYDDGVYHELHTSWQPDSCTTVFCTETGLKRMSVKCPPPPHHNCQSKTNPGDCCPVWVCGPDCSRVLCEGPPHPSCTPQKQPLDCCNKWNCSGCVDKAGVYHQPMSTWGKELCSLYMCVPGGLITTIPVHCPPFDPSNPPHPNCLEVQPEGECCPEWECGSECEDDAGVLHALYSHWQSDPCTYHMCTKEGIITRNMTCDLPDQPHSSCTKYLPPGECCPVWHCSRQCVDSFGTKRDVGEEWRSDDCTLHKCTSQGSFTIDLYEVCEILEPPTHTCELVKEPGECCPQWICH
ncbi:hypothetical protein Pcinc_021334 [Petrolisthes cinctipes]|uniref:VWFC domain-containing protein n=1 Tax=Petrolisthes cinctipes TaxID=88211 RepID=A0AAE1KF76_PETCI|nr:hypothetical protein Pcinc_021334 [Petrolisthes cinctipes]